MERPTVPLVGECVRCTVELQSQEEQRTISGRGAEMVGTIWKQKMNSWTRTRTRTRKGVLSLGTRALIGAKGHEVAWREGTME
jgi:hypothetical protein